MNDRALSMIGLAKKAGRVIAGTNLVSASVRSDRKPPLVLLASDASANTTKLICSACRHHGVDCRQMKIYSMDELSHAIGASALIACIAITDNGFATAILEKLNQLQACELK